MEKAALLARAAHLVEQLPRDNKCIICGTDIEVQGHHLVPRHLGGPEDGPLVSLCSLHHLMCHRTGAVDETKFTPKQMQLIHLIKKFIVHAKIIAEGQDPSLIDRNTIVKLPHALLQRAHKRKQDLGYSNMNDYLLWLVASDCQSL